MASVEPRDVTASPGEEAPAARNAAMESVVPAATWQSLGMPYREDTSRDTGPIGVEGANTCAGSADCQACDSIQSGYPPILGS
mmetsp:Transcript_7749/g.28107  ORF Transcript_7749/g.28107 Transcript_7749/m.28107 type:complete len:83 (-) Transcript_7749:662-910(-)